MSLQKVNFLYALTVVFYHCCWAATHDELRQCGVTGVYKARQSLIQSPNYPDNYSPNTCLDYVIRSPYRCPTKFHIQFLDFLLESSSNCTKDYLAIGLQNDGDDMDVLCGQVVGIKKYHTPDGVLRLRFFADDSPWTTAKGFKLLITRLACEREELARASDDPDDDETEEVNARVSSLPLPPTYNTSPGIFRNLSLHEHEHVPLAPFSSPSLPTYPSIPSSSGYVANYVPNAQKTESSNGNPCPPTQTAPIPNLYAASENAISRHQQLPLISEQYSSWQQQPDQSREAANSGSAATQTRQQINAPFSPAATTLQPCCATTFGQRRFYLSSPGFPRTAFSSILPTQPKDCEFRLEKYSPRVCRLRIVFKFFDFGQVYSGTGAKQGNIDVAIGTSRDVCTEDFIQIDGERFCGCRTDFVFNSYWGLGPKLIRMRIGYSGIPSTGFLLDIFQDDCNGIQNIPNYLPGVHQNSFPWQLSNAFNGGLAQQQSNGFTNSGQQQQISPNTLGNSAQQPLLVGGSQQQASVFPQQIYPNYQQQQQQNTQQYYAQNNPLWLQPPLLYTPASQFRSARNPKFSTSETTNQPLSVVETNSTRKEFYYFDGNEQIQRARLSDEPDADVNRFVNSRYTALRGRCTFDGMDIWRLSADYNWIMKPICYSPQGRWFSNVFG